MRARIRAHVYGTDVTTQAEVLAAIDKERRLELALEGDRFPDLVRTAQWDEIGRRASEHLRHLTTEGLPSTGMADVIVPELILRATA